MTNRRLIIILGGILAITINIFAWTFALLHPDKIDIATSTSLGTAAAIGAGLYFGVLFN